MRISDELVEIIRTESNEPSPFDEPNFEHPDGRGNGGWEYRDEDR